MASWSERRSEIERQLAVGPERPQDPACSLDERLHRTLLRIQALETSRKVVPSNLKEIAATSLSIDDFWSISTLSSSGPFNRVELVVPTSALTGTRAPSRVTYVVKTVDRRWAFRMRQQQSVMHELAVLRLGSHRTAASDSTRPSPRRIPQLYASFVSSTSFHLVLSHATGGDLWSILEAAQNDSCDGRPVGLPETWVRRWTAELVDAVEWLHSEGWAHRDIKPHNLLLLADGHLQLTDFGSAAPASCDSSRPPSTTRSRLDTTIARKYALTLVGTPDYIAPEVLRYAERVAQESTDFEDNHVSRLHDDESRAYGFEVDWWACGVVVYELLFGQAPFYAEEIGETYERIVGHERHLSIPADTAISRSARQFVETLLVSADQRPSSAEIKAHPWFLDVDWATLRTVPPPYTPPPFEPPDLSASASSSRPPQSTTSFTTFSASFFSSPGLSILRPSPSTQEGVRNEERKFWEAREIGGCTTLPRVDCFDSSDASTQAGGDRRLPRPTAVPFESPPLVVDSTARSALSYETPARPRFPYLDGSSARPRTTATWDGSGGSAPPPPSSVKRSRRFITDVEAWKEMQEHAWEVGTSARKAKAGAATRDDGGTSGTHEQARPTRMLFDDVARTGGASTRSKEVTKEVTKEARGRRDDDEPLGRLEARQQDMVRDLDEMGKKYGNLFELAAKANLREA
ncbi:hypothetical protein JCM10212_004047 [Sporobolomyces blumeae]